MTLGNLSNAPQMSYRHNIGLPFRGVIQFNQLAFGEPVPDTHGYGDYLRTTRGPFLHYGDYRELHMRVARTNWKRQRDQLRAEFSEEMADSILNQWFYGKP